LSPAFGSEVEHPPHGRRIVLTQPDAEQHIFGLAMVAEFFRREGWDVLGGVAGVGIDATAWVRRDWFDAVGFSIGSELSLPWLRNTVADVRRVSRNPAVVVLVGGPLFTLNPGWAGEVGADATADGRSAPQIAETIVVRRVQEQSGRARMS
jgi:methanogenic corrinoid protein MtbC1